MDAAWNTGIDAILSYQGLSWWDQNLEPAARDRGFHAA